MAYYAVVDDFREAVPHTVLAGGALRPRGLVGHTTEGGEGETGFLGTVQYLIDTPERSAGYHEGWYPKNGGFEARRITRPEHAAHSMNPRRPPWRDPPLERVGRILGDRWWDPNAVSYAIAIAGSTGVTIPRLISDPGFMAGARRRYAELQQQFAPSLADDPLFNHGEGQADRSDWGTFRATLLAPAPEEDDMITWLPVEEDWDTGTGDTTGASRTGTPGGQFWAVDADTRASVLKHFTESEVVSSSAESMDGLWRLVRYGDEILVMHRFNLRNPRNRRPAVGYGFPAPATGGVPKAELDAALAQISALTSRIQAKDSHIAGYPKG